MTASILVTGGEARAALAVVRSLGRAGHVVHVGAATARSLAGASRYAAGQAAVPDALGDPAGHVEAVRALVRRWSATLVLPCTDQSIMALLPHRERLDGAIIPLADLAAYRRASDKAEVTRLAASLGVSVPDQVLVRDRAAAAGLEDGGLSFPLVVKPTRSVVGEPGKQAKVGVAYASGAGELARRLGSLPADAFPVLLQQLIRGPGIGTFFLIWDGAIVARFAHRRIREKPPSGGVSVCCESIVADPALMVQASRLLGALGWAGPAMVEFKRDAATGRHYLMEINGRFWGSLQLAVDAGVDFPALLVAAALGQRPAPVAEYRVGVRLRWWWGEVDHLIAQLRRPLVEQGAGPWAIRGRAIRQFLMPGRRVRNEVLRRDDPLPALRESLNWLRGRE